MRSMDERHVPDLTLAALAQLVPAERCRCILDGMAFPHLADQAKAAFAYFEARDALDLVGQLIPHESPRYRLLRPLGTGGFGMTFEAERLLGGLAVPTNESSTSFGEDPMLCAIKLIRLDLQSHGDRTGTATAEMRRLFHAANSPNRHVLLLFDFDTTEVESRAGTYAFLVSPVVDDALPLDQWCRHRSFDEVIAVLLQTAEGVAHIHDELGLTHLDLKPDNVLVDADGVVRIVDLGLAASTGNPGHGTPGYAAPEQFNPDARVSPASDIFAMGVVVHQLLLGTSEPPQSNATPDPAAWTAYPQLSDCVQAGMCHLIAACTHEDPTQRPAGGRSLFSELAYISRGLPPACALSAPQETNLGELLAGVALAASPERLKQLHTAVPWDQLARAYARPVHSVTYLREVYAPAASELSRGVTGAESGLRVEAIDRMMDADRLNEHAVQEPNGHAVAAWTSYLRAAWRWSPREFAAAVAVLPETFLNCQGRQARRRAIDVASSV